ncbi:MAG: hypothetical protein A4S09_16475 [Proteobacteria bacterium SG_bin7]|nr:MAG: hypothetical protein A4S09_16475 [Proteobacteria bacterium SG_bin7]
MKTKLQDQCLESGIDVLIFIIYIQYLLGALKIFWWASPRKSVICHRAVKSLDTWLFWPEGG